MSIVSVRIYTKEEKNAYKHADLFKNFDSVVPEGRLLKLIDFIILEGGTENGNISVMFRMEDRNGKEYVTQATGKIIDACFSAFIGATQRFSDHGK